MPPSLLQQLSAAATSIAALAAVAASERMNRGFLTDDEWVLAAFCAIGSVLGGFISCAMSPPRNPTIRNISMRWAVAIAATMCFGPWVIHFAAAKLSTEATPFFIMGASGVMSFSSWRVLSYLIRALPEAIQAFIGRILNIPRK